MTIDDLAGAVAQADAAPLDLAVALIRPFIADIGWLEGLLVRECAALAVDPQHMPPWRASRRGGARHLVLARTERIWVSASCIDPARDEAAHPDRVHLSGRYTLCRPLGRPLRGRDFQLRDGRLVPTGVVACAAGSWFERDERSETVRIMPESGRVLLLRAQVAPPGAVVAGLYDMADGMPTVRAQVDEGHARLLMLLSLLRLQRRTDAAPLFEAALDAPLGGQRWAVMREYLALDTARAQPSLEKMALRDPEEKVRDMARRTMAQARAVSCPR
ncbi:hypothetical protein PMI04_016740 [Sphingobium sp. AP49]|uniref:hypothetical protein n=1 Tax=Sphingobium sp. AP49 TaxID=1144307 RepID=UPI00026ECB55|nr:hypothetical protein [Sphingobium sp. AP49]WHO38190.1 hypothetical protein PMI04_016740 [Sphingobium sp. AP49]